MSMLGGGHAGLLPQTSYRQSRRMMRTILFTIDIPTLKLCQFPSEPQKDWRALINNNTSKQNILIYLLERAHEILKDPKCMVLQELEEARQEYSRLIVGDIGEIIKTHFEIRADTKGVGVGWINFLNLVREESGSKISKNHLMQILESMGLEKKSRQYSREAENEGSYMICGPSEGIQRTLIMGMKMKDNVDCSKCKERV